MADKQPEHKNYVLFHRRSDTVRPRPRERRSASTHSTKVFLTIQKKKYGVLSNGSSTAAANGTAACVTPKIGGPRRARCRQNTTGRARANKHETREGSDRGGQRTSRRCTPVIEVVATGPEIKLSAEFASSPPVKPPVMYSEPILETA